MCIIFKKDEIMNQLSVTTPRRNAQHDEHINAVIQSLNGIKPSYIRITARESVDYMAILSNDDRAEALRFLANFSHDDKLRSAVDTLRIYRILGVPFDYATPLFLLWQKLEKLLILSGLNR